MRNTTTNSTKRRLLAITTITAALAAPLEGLRQIYYYDPVGVLTVCYGHIKNVDKTKYYTKEECLELLNEEMLEYVKGVDKCQPGLPDNVLIAFSDAAYNLGLKVACNTKRSTAARYLSQGRYEEACNQLPRWNKAKIGGIYVELKGLTKRRLLERDICLSNKPYIDNKSYLTDINSIKGIVY